MNNQRNLGTTLGNRANGGQKPAAPTTLAGLAGVKSLLGAPAMQKRFEEVLGKRSPQFAASIIDLVSADSYLQKCEPMSVLTSAMTAAVLNLPINKSLGYAWVVPYKNKDNVYVAQFQIGWKGLVQLALRTAQYKSINAIPLLEGQMINWDPLTEEAKIDFAAKRSDVITHYCGTFELINGFRKTVMWTKEQIIAHAKKYSKSYSKSSSAWQDPDKFEGMALKTVVRNMLSKWGILSIEMQQAFDDDVDSKMETDNNMAAGEVIDMDPSAYQVRDDEDGGDGDGGEHAAAANQDEMNFGNAAQ